MRRRNIEQFDVYRLRDGDLVVVPQHSTFVDFKTRVVAQLIPLSRGKLATSLNPILRHSRRDMVLATHLLSVVPLSAFSTHLGSLAKQEYAIKRALDELFYGI